MNVSKFSSRLFFAVLLFCAGAAISETHAATINVDRFDDTAAATACTAAANDCSLRGAFAFANANSGTVINLPAGTYNLSINELQVGTATNVSTTITGAGAGVTTITQTAANRRVINLNPSLAANVVVSISDVRITGGNSPSDSFGGGGLIGGGAGNTLNLTNCVFENNSDISSSSTPKGGGIEWAGGGFLNIDNCRFTNNTAGSAPSNLGVGGGVDYQLLNLGGASGQGGLSITNSTFTNNRAGAANSGAGGGLAVTVTTTQTPRAVNITNNTFTGNQANASGSGRGGAITSSSSNPLTIKFNRIVGNTATGNLGTGVYQSTGTVGTIDATQNWWGCNLGPNNPGCDSIGGVTANITTNPRIVLSHTANPNSITVGQATGLTASFLRDSANNVLTTANISRLLGLPITFNSPVRGAISNAQTTIQANGTGSATFTSNAAGAGSVNAVVDNQATQAPITINKANTTITMVSDTPDPTVTGQSYLVTFNAPAVVAFGVGTPTGTVTVSDGTNSCTATLPALSCNLISLTAGAKNLTATYNGDANYNASPASASIPHTVSPANTTTTITADTPDPSVFGQNYTVSANVSVNSPGGGTPSGAIIVSDGTNNCTITLPATGCTLPSDSTGAKNLTAVYGGDANYLASPPSVTVTHIVNQAGTATVITSTAPNPSSPNQNVVVNYAVTAAAPGAGTPTGTVTVSDGANSCTGTVSDGQCTIVLPASGTYSLTATYSGDTNFTPSSSPIFTQQVCGGSSLMVSNTDDGGDGSLRHAVANICTGGTITFSPDFNTAQTITLTSGEITINRDFTISGAGADLLTINANNLGRAFQISSGIVNLSGMTITGGSAGGDENGGAISNAGGTLTLTNIVVSGSTAPNLGGGIYNAGSLTVIGSTISGNTANNAIGETGGGIHSTGSLLIVNSTVSGNFAPNGDNNGGGIRIENNASIINSTITDNSAGGANSASGIFVSAGAATIRSSIIAANQNNAAIPDTAGAFDPASAFNLIGSVGTATGFSAANQNQTGNAAAPLDPLLAALTNNGGTTPTHRLLDGSPAIDKGGAAAVPFAESFLPPVTTDQRGTMRPIEVTSIPNAPGGDGSDIGSFEAAAPTAANVSVGGRILSADGRAVSRAIVTLTDVNGITRSAVTNQFGYYHFDEIAAGETYVLAARHKSYQFTPQVVSVSEDLTDLNLIANEAELLRSAQ